MTSKAVFGSVLAAMFLALYALLVGTAVLYPAIFTASMADYLAVIGAFVSAVVIAELAVTEPGSPPMAQALSNPTPANIARARWLSALYVGVWIMCGVACLIYGWFKPDASAVVVGMGKAFFGTTAAAVYAYMGVKPARQEEPPNKPAGVAPAGTR